MVQWMNEWMAVSDIFHSSQTSYRSVLSWSSANDYFQVNDKNRNLRWKMSSSFTIKTTNILPWLFSSVASALNDIIFFSFPKALGSIHIHLRRILIFLWFYLSQILYVAWWLWAWTLQSGILWFKFVSVTVKSWANYISLSLSFLVCWR